MSDRSPYGGHDMPSYGEQAATRQAKKDLEKLYSRVSALEEAVKALQDEEEPDDRTHNPGA